MRLSSNDRVQSPQAAGGKVMVRGQQAVQVVQQVNQAGQVVHQVLQTVPQSPSPQASPVAPLSALGELLSLSQPVLTLMFQFLLP